MSNDQDAERVAPDEPQYNDHEQELISQMVESGLQMLHGAHDTMLHDLSLNAFLGGDLSRRDMQRKFFAKDKMPHMVLLRRRVFTFGDLVTFIKANL